MRISRVVAAAAALIVGLLGLVTWASPSEATGGWSITTTPPRLSNPTNIELSANTDLAVLDAWSVHCAGYYHRIDLDQNEDAIISFDGGQALRHPVWIVGGRNVRVVGLEMALETQEGCDVGELPNIGSTARSIHPRLPGGMAVRLENWGTSFVEGVDIDLLGHEADCFVVRNPPSLDNAEARTTRHVVLQNTNCRGIEGLGRSSIGDGIHGDLLQNQGHDVISSLVIENVTVRTSMEGLVLHEWNGYPGARSLKIRRFDYAADSRYDNDDQFEQWGAPFAAWADNWSLEEVYASTDAKLTYGFVNDERWGERNFGNVRQHNGITEGAPPAGAFAPPSRVGRGYVSPHGGTPAATSGTAGDSGAASPAAAAAPASGSDTSTPAAVPAENDQIVRLYQAALGREPDRDGLVYWRQRATAGLSLNAMAAHFSHSNEWNERFGRSISNSAFVTIMYHHVLDRSPDREGEAYWLGRLQRNDVTRTDMLVFFSESPENVKRTSTG